MRIGDLALLSDCRTAALVDREGTVSWFSPGRFDAPSIFGRLLDADAGHWTIRPRTDADVERSYLDEGPMRFAATASCANDLGLMAEEVALDTGEPLGNFPQALSHVGLINAAWRLSEARKGHDLQ